MLAIITPVSFTAGAEEVNHLTLTADADWLTYNEEIPHITYYAGAFNPDFLKSLKVTFTGDENIHLTKVIISGTQTGEVTGPVTGPVTGTILGSDQIDLVIAAPLGVGDAIGPGIIEASVIADLSASIAADLTSELVATGNFVLGEPNPNFHDATRQIDIEFSLLDALRRLPDGTAIVPISPVSVAELLAIPAQITGDWAIKVGEGAPSDVYSLALLLGTLAALGISDSIAASTGDVTIDVGDKDDTVDLATFDHNATVLLGDGNDTLKLGLGNDTVQGGNGDDTFIFTPTGTTTTQALNGGPGADMIQIDGTPGDDIFTFSMGGVGNKDLIIKVSGDGPGTPVTTSIIPDFANQSIEQIVVAGNFGDDKFIVDDSHGAIPSRLTFQAGGGEDHLQLVGDPGANGFTVKSENLDFGSVPTFGGIHELVMEDAAGNDVTQTIIYDGFDLNSEFIEDSLPGPLQIQSNYSSSTVVIGGSTESPDPANPDFASIAVGVYGPIKFKNKTRLVYNGGIAGDGIAIDAESLSKSNPNLTSFIVNCGAGDDSVDVTTAPGANLHIVINGNGGDDVLSGDADLHGGDGDDILTGGDGNYVIDGGGDDDTLQINGSDAVSLSFAANTLTLGINAQTDIYQLIDLESISLTTGGDNDVVVVTNLDQYAGGLAMDLGDGSDRVTYVSTTTHILLSDYPSAVFSGAPLPGSGTGRLSLDDVTTTFANVEEVDLGGSGQTVDYRAPDDGSSIHVLGMGATTELRLNADAKVVLKNNPTRLDLSGLSGEDTFIIDPNAGTSLTEINITGNDFHSDDEVVLNGRTTPDALNYTPGADFGSGGVQFNAIAVNFKFIEGLSFNGQGGADAMTLTTPVGNTVVTFTPGADANSGSLKLRQELGGELLGFSYLNVNGVTTTLSVVNSGGLGDSLIVNGTNDDDVFTVAAVAGGSVRLGNPALPNPIQSVLINTPGVARLELHGGDGDDVFNIPGNHSYAGFPGVSGINIQGGNPSASDTLNFTGSAAVANLITMNFGASTVQEATFAAVDFTGVETLNVDAAMHTPNLAVVATAVDDDLKVTMFSVSSGRVERGPGVQKLGDVLNPPTSPVLNYKNLAAPTVAVPSNLAIDLAGGADTLIVVGNALSQTFNVNAFTAAVPFPVPYGNVPARTIQVDNGNNGSLDGTLTYTNNESVQIYGLEGNDTINATPGPTPVFVDGGDPIGTSAGDRLVVVANLNPVLLEAGPERDEGGVVFGGDKERVSFDHIEAITIDSPDCVLILGTNADDDITIIARDASTHPGADGRRDFTAVVNDGIEVLYTNVGGNAADPTIIGELHIDAMAGDDDVVIRTPAPNLVNWSMDVEVAGGTPAAVTGDQGDVLELEALGTNPVIFSATGPDSGTILVDTNANGTFQAGDTRITMGQFFDACPPINYDSSPGGVEHVIVQSQGGYPLTLNGTAANDTATINADGTGTFRSTLSPAFDYSGAGPVIVNGGPGTDSAIYNGTIDNDVIDSQQTTATLVSTTVNGLTHPANNTEIIGINTLTGADLIRIGVSDALETANPAASARFDVDAGDADASDRLIVQDLGLGDLDIVRQGTDGRSGSVTIGGFKPVVYKNLKRVDITPIDPVSGGTGTDGKGRIKVFHSDPFEYNDTRLTAGQLQRVGQSSTSPTIDPGALTIPFAVSGDEDWYEFRPQGTGTFQVKVLFDMLATLSNGRPGLPGNGDLSLDIYDANGTLITSGVTASGGKAAIFAATNDPAFSQFNRIYIRVHGATPTSINLYDFDNIAGLVSGNPGSGVSSVDVFGPQVTDVSINHIPTATYNLFGQKPGNAAQGPTPPTTSLVVHFQDPPSRAPGFLYPALDPNLTADEARGLFEVKGDATGIVVIDHVVITQNPAVLGQAPTSTVEIFFTAPLLDDRYTLIVDDSLRDPANNRLDGESNADEPNGAPKWPSGNGSAGGDFVARFTIDSRPEIGNYSAGSAFIDVNGNYVIDPQGNAADVTNRDLTFQIGTVSDALFAGKFELAAGAGVNDNDGFDKLGAYGFDNVAKKYRFLLDFDHDGIGDLRVVSAFQVNGSPVAGNFAPGHNGDEIGLFDGQNWYLDNVGDNQLHVKIVSNMRGQPIVGDFNGDGKDDLATYDAKSNTFFFDTNRDGQTDDTIVFSGPLNGNTENPVAGDLNLDGIDDLGLRVTGRQGSPTPNIAEWYFVLSDHTGQTLPHNVFDKYAPSPLGNDLFAQFGDYVSLPVFGNFDPPVGAGSDGPSETNVLNVLDVDNDGVVTAQDALIIINQLNGMAQSASADDPRYVDVDGDGAVTPSDVLRVINFINNSSNQPSGGDLADAEGEATDASLPLGEEAYADAVQDDLLLLLASDMASSNPRSKP